MPTISLRSRLLVCAVLGALSFQGFVACGCSGKESSVSAASPTLLREQAAAHFAKQEITKAREAMQPLVSIASPAYEDLIRAASIEIADDKGAAAKDLLERAAKLEPNDAAVTFLRGQLAREGGDLKGSEAFLKSAHAAAPKDLATTLALAQVESELENVAEAEKLYRSVVAVGIENAQMWYAIAVFRLARLLTESGRENEAQHFNEVYADLKKRGFQDPQPMLTLLGTFGRVPPPLPAGSRPDAFEGPIAFVAQPVVLPELGGARVLVACDLDGDLQSDLLAYGPRGLFAGFRAEKGFVAVKIAEGPIDLAIAYDADNDSDLDVLALAGGKLALYVQGPDRTFARAALEFPPLPAPPKDFVAVDYDHEGDLDILLAGSFGARIWRRDGQNEIEKGGKYVDATPESGLPTSIDFDWCITEDFDGDNDVDFLFGGKSGLYVADSLRAGKFTERRNVFDWPPSTAIAKPFVADLDGDALPDLWVPGEPSTLVLQKQKAKKGPNANVRAQTLVATDIDLDGALDVLWVDPAGSLKGELALGNAAERALGLKNEVKVDGPLTSADFDGDHAPDLAYASADGVHVLKNLGPHGNGVRISYRGVRDNRRAVGAIVEYRTGGIYRRIYWRGDPVIAGVGKQKKLDVLRITWPNGITSTDLDLDLGPQAGVDDPDAAFNNMTQGSGLYGSCPFLYAWNGTTYGFVSDVLGITPLGLPIAPGEFVPPDHDEYVLVRGEQLAPKDGKYELQITEELREVTYLDHAKLLVVDHPADTEVFPNELFKFPPFPAAHIHTIKGALEPTSATGSDGKDWRAALSKIDDDCATPMVLQPPQFVGLAQPWFVELAFDKAAVAHATKMRLLMTGWFFWSDASANMASARNPDSPFIPPMFQVPDGNGGWKDAGDPIGFPAGKTKTMVIDVSDVLSRDDPRIRVFTTLRLYWDALRLAVDDDDAPTRVTEIACGSARLWHRGFSAPIDWASGAKPGDPDPRNRPERFDWNVLAKEPRWNQHPGLYTRYGACLPLLGSIDDEFVILGAGDALTLGFDAKTAPPLEKGFRRDFLLFLDGWAKDRDPNTIQALEVEPLPFHAMSGYPYRPDEHFPSDAAHEKWRAEWNTRPAFEWIRPVSPRRESGWLLGEPTGS